MSIRPGFYSAKITDYGFRVIKSGANQGEYKPFITFKVERPEGDFDTLNWDGNFLNETGIEIAMKVFTVCGMKSGADIERLGEGFNAGILDDTKDYRVKVDIQKDRQDERKTYTKITGVYDAQSDAISEAPKQNEVRAKLAHLNLKASFDKVKGALPPEPKKPLPPAGF